MPELDASRIREMTDDEIEEEIELARDEIASLRYRSAIEELENPLLLRTRRRDLARLKTIRHERASETAAGERSDD